jgi:hypothetical protein
MSPDPAGTVDGLNLYAFVSGNPVKYEDIGGLGKGPKFAVRLEKSKHKGWSLKVIGRPNKFAARTLAALALKYPNLHEPTGTNLKDPKKYSRVHENAYMTLAKKPRTKTRGFSHKQHRDHILSIKRTFKNSRFEKRFNTLQTALKKSKQNAVSLIEQAHMLLIREDYNDEENIRIDDSKKNSSDGAKMKISQAWLSRAHKKQTGTKAEVKQMQEKFKEHAIDSATAITAAHKANFEEAWRTPRTGKYM